MVMSLAEIDLGIGRLSDLVAKIEGFDPNTVTDRWGGEVTALKASIDATLADVFGHGSEDYRRYLMAKEIDRSPHTSRRGGIPIADLRVGFQSGKDRALGVVRGTIATLED